MWAVLYCSSAVTYRGERKVLTPEEISAMVLGKMRDIAASKLGEEVKQVRAASWHWHGSCF